MNNEPVAWMVDGMLFTSLGAALNISFDIEQPCIPLYTHPVKDLTDKEINKLWKKSHEDGIAMQQGFATQQHYFAHLLLKKASEK